MVVLTRESQRRFEIWLLKKKIDTHVNAFESIFFYERFIYAAHLSLPTFLYVQMDDDTFYNKYKFIVKVTLRIFTF